MVPDEGVEGVRVAGLQDPSSCNQAGGPCNGGCSMAVNW